MINALLLVLAWGAFSAVARAEKLDFVYMPLYSEAAPAD